jgi:hypothetical protein
MLTRLVSVVTVWVILLGALPVSAWPVGRDTEEQLEKRLSSERNPVKRAKYEIRLGRMKLEQAIGAYEQGDVELGTQLLTTYLEWMRSSWQTLRSSGRPAARQPQGFKELDIALRGDTRLLQDLARRVSYFERGPVEKAVKEIEEIRGEVLRALFPALKPQASGKNFAHYSGYSSMVW